jgi:hypothetical protein
MSQKYSVYQTTNFVSKALTPDSKAFLPAAQFPSPALRWGGGIGRLRACRSTARPSYCLQ